MTDLEINIAIAEAMPRCKICGWKATVGHRCSHSPDYCHDLNAMHEAEASQLWPDAAFWNRYSLELGGLCNSLAPALHATARERAEAFLRTIGKWKP